MVNTFLATWLFAGVTLLLFEGVGVVSSIARVVGPPTAAIGSLVVVVTLGAAPFVARRRQALWLVMVGMMSASGEAFVVRESDRVVVVPADEDCR